MHSATPKIECSLLGWKRATEQGQEQLSGPQKGGTQSRCLLISTNISTKENSVQQFISSTIAA
jgi:hypothetical protein